MERRPESSPASALARCVGDVPRFNATIWGRQPLVTTSIARGSDGDHFEDVLSLDAVDEFVTNSARLPAIRMILDGSPLAPRQFCTSTRLGGRELLDVIDPVKVVARLGEGATLVLQSLHRTSVTVAAFVTHLQDEISHPVQANAYLTPPEATGLAEHADLHDVFALQLHGSKQWWVEGLGDLSLHPGDVMYIPRGVRHRADTATETSLHLTIGIIRVTYRQVIERVLQHGPASLDDPLPIGYRHPAGRDGLERGVDLALEDVLDLIGAADPEIVAVREQNRRLAPPPRVGRISSISRVDDLGLASVIQWAAPQPLAKLIQELDGQLDDGDGRADVDQGAQPPDRVTIDVGDRVLTLPTTTLSALRLLGDGHPVRVTDLPGLDEPGRLVLARRLVREAACVIVTFDG